MTPKGYLNSLTQSVSHYARYNDAAALQNYIDGAHCWDCLLGIKDNPQMRRQAIRTIVKAMSKCSAKLDEVAPVRPAGAKKRPGFWTPEVIARFRVIVQKEGLEGAARQLNISMDAARRARLRHCREPGRLAA